MDSRLEVNEGDGSIDMTKQPYSLAEIKEGMLFLGKFDNDIYSALDCMRVAIELRHTVIDSDLLSQADPDAIPQL